MRCAIRYNEDENLFNQKLTAWSEMQSMKEEPAYREEDITEDADFFKGYKFAIDEAMNLVRQLAEDGDITEDAANEFNTLIMGNVCMMLFSILDEQGDE